MRKHVYRLVAWLINPNAEWQREELTEEEYNKAVNDYKYLQSHNITKYDKDVMAVWYKYEVEDGHTTSRYCSWEYIVEEDCDGIYLFKKIS